MTVQHQHARQRENFPVASLLLPAKYRQTILYLYDFARGADNIADDSCRAPDAKVAQIAALQHAWQSKSLATLPDWAQGYAHIAFTEPSLHTQARLLLDAFHQDCTKTRYSCWEEVMAYCQRSATPIGRSVLIICKEDTADVMAAMRCA